ncbi:MAG: hypothetical protein IPM38_10335 [Ignavibacteria bacterium]|nr:hypothetical protein [Ignavibacteria bacterium]
MFKNFLSFCFILTLLFSVKVKAQDEALDDSQMLPPPGIVNQVYEDMTGNWTAESDMMGIPMVQDLKIYWDINHQFLILDLRSTGKEDVTKAYQGKGIFGVDQMGNAKTWWFDSWGADNISIGSGAFSDNKVTINNSNSMMTETRSFLVAGNEMIMNAKGTMNMSGKEIPYDETIIFRR